MNRHMTTAHSNEIDSQFLIHLDPGSGSEIRDPRSGIRFRDPDPKSGIRFIKNGDPDPDPV